MATLNTTPPAAGVIEHATYGGRWKRSQLAQKVSVTAGAASVLLNEVLPPRCRLIWGMAKNMTAVTFATGTSGTGTPAVFAVVVSTASAMSTSVLATTTGTSFQGAAMLGPTSTNQNAVANKALAVGLIANSGGTTQDNTANTINESTSPLYLHLVPCNNGTATNQQRFNVAAGGFTVAANGTVDVVLHFDEFYDTPDAA